MAHLGFPAPGDKVSLGAPARPIRGSIDAKNELGVKGRRKLTRMHGAYTRFMTRVKTSHDCDVTEMTLEF